MAQDQHQTIRQLIDTAGSTLVSVGFFKKDGSTRWITFNPKDHNEIKGTGTPCQDPNIFRVREIRNADNDRKPAWRSFDGRRVFAVKVRGEVFTFENQQ